MLTTFIIYVRSMVLYAIFTLPALIFPPVYGISLVLMFIYGWVAFVPFMFFFLLLQKLKLDGAIKLLLLFIAIPGCVWVAYILLCYVTNFGTANESVFLLFPAAGVIAGWISLFISEKRIRNNEPHHLLSFEEDLNEKQIHQQ